MALRNSKKNTPSQIPAFLLKSFELLQKNEHENTISWSEDGYSFIVKDVEDLETTVLPIYFKHNKFTSFIRQLNMYGFNKIRHKNKMKEFRHKFFRKDRENLLYEIKRKNPESNMVSDCNFGASVNCNDEWKGLDMRFENGNDQKSCQNMTQKTQMTDQGQSLYNGYKTSQGSNTNQNQLESSVAKLNLFAEEENTSGSDQTTNLMMCLMLYSKSLKADVNGRDFNNLIKKQTEEYITSMKALLEQKPDVSEGSTNDDTESLGKRLLNDGEDNLQDLVIKKKIHSDNDDDIDHEEFWMNGMYEHENNLLYFDSMKKDYEDISFLGRDVSDFF